MLRHLSQTIAWMDSKKNTDLTVVSHYHRPLAHRPLSDFFIFDFPVSFSLSMEKEFLAWQFGLPTLAGLKLKWIGIGDYRLEHADLAQPIISHLPKNVTERIILTTGTLGPSVGDDSFLPAKQLRLLRETKREENWLRLLKKTKLEEEYAKSVANRAGDFSHESCVAVHFRNTDLKSDFESSIVEVRKLLSEFQLNTVYWSTDDKESLVAARSHLREVDVIGNQTFAIQGNGRNIHENLDEASTLKHIKNVFQDLFTLSSAKFYVPTTGRSEWTGFVNLLRCRPDLIRSFFGLDLTKDL